MCLDLNPGAAKCSASVPEGHTYSRVGANGWRNGIDDERDAHVTDGVATAAGGRDAQQQRDQTEAGDTFRSHAQVHAGRRAVAGGNMWKYIATTIGRKTMVL